MSTAEPTASRARPHVGPAGEALDPLLEAPDVVQGHAVVALVAAADVDGEEREVVEEQAGGRVERQLQERVAGVVDGPLAVAGKVVGDAAPVAHPAVVVGAERGAALLHAVGESFEGLGGFAELTEEVALAQEVVAPAPRAAGQGLVTVEVQELAGPEELGAGNVGVDEHPLAAVLEMPVAVAAGQLDRFERQVQARRRDDEGLVLTAVEEGGAEDRILVPALHQGLARILLRLAEAPGQDPPGRRVGRQQAVAGVVFGHATLLGERCSSLSGLSAGEPALWYLAI